MPSSSEIDSSVSRCKRIVAPFRVSSYRCLIERAWLSGRRIWLQGTIAKIDPQKFSICAKHRRLMLPVHVHGATAKFNFFPPFPSFLRCERKLLLLSFPFSPFFFSRFAPRVMYSTSTFLFSDENLWNLHFKFLDKCRLCNSSHLSMFVPSNPYRYIWK